MTPGRSLGDGVLGTIPRGKILGIRAGTQPHRAAFGVVWRMTRPGPFTARFVAVRIVASDGTERAGCQHLPYAASAVIWSCALHARARIIEV